MLSLTGAIVAAGQVAAPPGEIVPRDWLVIPALDVNGRRPIRCDKGFARHLLDRKAAPPEDGEKLTGELGKEAAWEKKQASDAGAIEGELAWGFTSIESPAPCVMMAELAGASTMFVNGTAFVGDAYRYGFHGVPVALRAGKNDVYVTGIRGSFSLKLRAPPGPLVLADWDATLPDAGAGDAAVLVMNATERKLDLVSPSKRTLVPLAATKVPFAFDLGTKEIGKHPLKVEVSTAGDGPKASAAFEIEIRPGHDACRRTFRSRIDGSVQPYAVLPPSGAKEPEGGLGLVLTLHGAGVDALGQVRCYSPKDDFWIVAPTNRRPFGFDWQDWGRLDAYEVLGEALALSHVDPSRICLTGHSMGGHGTWHLAANDPDCFAAIAPSAGWASFDTYGERPKGALAELWHRADGAGLTLDLVANLAWIPIYILHGTADDNVPVSEAQSLEKALHDAGAKPEAHYQAGAGHWWDGDASPGVDCVDWPPIFDLFRKSRIPAKPARLDWIGVDPTVDSRHDWIEVAQPQRYGQPFRVRASFDAKVRRIEVATENVRRLRIDPLLPRAAVAVDGATLDLPKSGWCLREGEAWKADPSGPPPEEKDPSRSGPFKLAFERRFVLVYGTAGDAAEDQELLDLARYESQVWWYRGNGSVRLMDDREFLAQRAELGSCNVILFGNEDTNAAWKVLVPEGCPICARRGSIRLGEEAHEGPGLACLFVYPRADAPALVGAFADSGPAGTRLLVTVPVFVSGVGLPDYALFGPEVLTKGDGGVISAGWFDHAWKL